MATGGGSAAVGRRRHQLADLVGSLLHRPARQSHREYQDHRSSEALLRQRRCVPAAQADRAAVRPGVGRRAMGQEVHGERSHSTVRPEFDRRQLRAVLDGQELRFPQRPEGRHRIPVLVVHRSDLLQPGQGQDAADVLGITDRSPIQGPDRRREHSDRPDGDRRNRHRFQVSVRVDPRSDLVRCRLPVIAQAEHRSSWRRRTTRSSR